MNCIKEHTQQLFERLMQGCKVHHPRKKHSLLYHIWLPLHYRLRCSLGFWNEQKVDKSRCLFLSQKTPLNWRKWFFDQNMTQILYQKSFITFSENKYGQNDDQCSGKVEGGLSGGWFLVWWKYRPFREKKLKIASFTKAPFMVKLDF